MLICPVSFFDHHNYVLVSLALLRALQRLTKWTALINEQESLERKKYINITLTHGDATVISWSDADVVFINSTCFDDSLLEKLAEQASDLKPGTFVFTITKV
jgi:hypothetical protein